MAGLLPTSGGRSVFRVLWLIDSLTAGGAESLTASLAEHHDTRRLELHIGCLKRIDGNDFEQRIRDSGTPLKIFNIRNLRDVTGYRHLLNHVRELMPDVIHSHLTSSSIYGSLLSMQTGIPLVSSMHVMPEKSRGIRRKMLRQQLEILLLRRHAARIIMVSAAARDAWIANGTFRPDRLHVIHNGIPVIPTDTAARQRVRQKLGLEADKTVIACISVMRPGKGLEYLLEAFARLRQPGLRLLLIGDGPERYRLESLSGELGITDRITWTGFRHDTAHLLAASDLFVLPSLFDAFPTVLIEAMMLGIPVIASNTGGIPEIVQHDRSGLLTRPGSPFALQQAVNRLLEDPGLASSLAEHGRYHAMQQLSLSAWQERLLSCYQALANPATHGLGQEAT